MISSRCLKRGGLKLLGNSEDTLNSTARRTRNSQTICMTTIDLKGRSIRDMA